MSYMVTPLGRTVHSSDWKNFQGDVALKILHDYDSTQRVVGEPYYPLSIEKLYLGSAMGKAEAYEVALYLAERGCVVVSGHSVYLTEDGLKFVSKCYDDSYSVCSKCGR